MSFFCKTKHISTDNEGFLRAAHIAHPFLYGWDSFSWDGQWTPAITLSFPALPCSLGVSHILGLGTLLPKPPSSLSFWPSPNSKPSPRALGQELLSGTDGLWSPVSGALAGHVGPVEPIPRWILPNLIRPHTSASPWPCSWATGQWVQAWGWLVLLLL